MPAPKPKYFLPQELESEFERLVELYQVDGEELFRRIVSIGSVIALQSLTDPDKANFASLSTEYVRTYCRGTEAVRF